MIGMAEQCFAIFGRNAGGSQTTRQRVAQVMDANERQSRVASGALPTVVVHRVDTSAVKREHPDWMQQSLCSTIDQATSFRTTTWGRFVLKASGGITNTLRPTSGTAT